MNAIPRFWNYGEYASSNYGAHTLAFQDAKGNKFFFSYKTIVAFQKAGELMCCCKNVWSTTTGKHLNWLEPDHSNRLTYSDFANKFEKCFGTKL